MKIHPAAQGSVEWMQARAGIPTASEFDALITPLGKIRTGAGVDTYLSKKLAERWLQGPLPGFGSWATDQGKILEERARPWFEMQFNVDVKQVGFITNDAGTAGCSPDGMLPVCGVEIKCPEAPNHVAYLMAGKVPADYIAQVQGSMFITGFRQWKFVSYHKDFPKLILAVEPDEEFHEHLAEALDAFTGRLEEGYKLLCEANGGPPPKREPMVFSTDRQPQADNGEGITP